MDAIALHLEVRNALSLCDELGRYEHALGNDALAGHLAASRTSLDELERMLGRSHEVHITPSPVLIESIERQLGHLRDQAEGDQLPNDLHPRVVLLLEALERIVFAELRPDSPIPAKPIAFGMLPIARVIPQDVHSAAVDWLSAAAYFASAKLARTRRGRITGLVLGASAAKSSLLSDVRLSAIKVLPVEAHEVLDHACGAAAMTAPFLLGYVKADPIAAAIQIFTGLGVIALSLFTDYRAYRGVGGRALSHMSAGGLTRARRGGPRQPHLRPLEGLAGPSYIPPADL